MRKSMWIKLFVFGVFLMFGGCGKVDYTECFNITNTMPVIDGVENKMKIEYEIANTSEQENIEFIIEIEGKENEYSIEPKQNVTGEFVFALEKPVDAEVEYNVTYEVKKR